LATGQVFLIIKENGILRKANSLKLFLNYYYTAKIILLSYPNIEL